MVVFRDIVGTQANDMLTVANDILTMPATTIVYGLGGDDTLSTSVSNTGNNVTDSSILVGSSGADQYIVANNSTAIILDHSNSAGDCIVATGIGFNSNTTSILEIDNSRHFVAYDEASGQTLIILDWQNPANQIESLQLSDGTFTYQYIVDNLHGSSSYLDMFTLEQADHELLGGLLATSGLTSSSIDQRINQIQDIDSLLNGNFSF